MRYLYGIFVICAVIMLFSCGQGNSQAQQSNAGESSAEMSGNPFSDSLSPNDEYIFVLCLGNIEYFNAHKYEWNKLGELFGVTTTIMGPPDFDLPATAAAMDQAIAKNPRGICLFGVDPSLDPSIDKAIEAGIPVSVIVGDQPDSARMSYIGSYGQDLGYIGGKRLAEELGGTGQVAILTIPGFEQWDIREQGYRRAFAEYPGIEVVAVGDTKADTVTAIQTAKDIMIRFPDLAGFVGCDSTAAIGAATAVEELDKVGRVKIVGMDRNSDIIEKIADNVLLGTVAQNDASMVYWALLTLISRNEYSPLLSTNNQASNARLEPDLIYLPPNFIDISNMDYYLEANTMYASGS